MGIKCALEVMGICNGYLAHPLRQFEGAEREAIVHYVEEVKDMTGKTAFT